MKDLSTLEIFLHQEKLSSELKAKESANQAIADGLVKSIFELPEPTKQLNALNALVDLANNFPSSLQFNIFQSLKSKFDDNHFPNQETIDPVVDYRIWSLTHLEPFFDDNEIPYRCTTEKNCTHFDFVLRLRDQQIEQWKNNEYPYPIQPTLNFNY